MTTKTGKQAIKSSKPKKWTVELGSNANFNGLYQVWDKDGNAPKNDERMRRRIERILNSGRLK